MPRQWTEQQKAERSLAVKAYWATHPHPSKGRHHDNATLVKMKKRKNRNPIAAHCVNCGRALYNKESAKRGLGPICAGIH